MKPSRRIRLRKVLVIDPSLQERNSIRQILKEDYVVITSGDLRASSKLAEEEKFDIALIGTDLPVGPDGVYLQALMTIWPPLPSILLLDESWRKKAPFLSNEWLFKPVHAEELKEKINRILLEKDWYEKRVDSFSLPTSHSPLWGREIFVEALISILAHEIKNPLVAVNTFSSLLPDKFDDREFRNDFSRLASLEIGRINNVLDRLFEYSNLFYPKTRPIPLDSFLGNFLGKQASNLSRYEVGVITNLEGNLPAINFDPEHLDFVFRGIFEHLFSSAARGKPLRVSAILTKSEKGGGRKLIEVKIGVDQQCDEPQALQVGVPFDKWSLSLLLAWRIMARDHSLMEVTRVENQISIGLLFPIVE